MNVVNKLKGSSCYLVGSMDASPDGGKGWRDDITPFLESLNIKVYNPCSKPIDIGINEQTARGEIQKLKDERRFDEIRTRYKSIRTVDLRMTDKADLIIFFLDLDRLTVGSWEEAFTANRAKKPVLFVIKQGDKSLYSNWLFWTFPHEFLFESWDELKQYLVNVDSGKDTRTFNRWYFFNN
jgi:hypothetical protein